MWPTDTLSASCLAKKYRKVRGSAKNMAAKQKKKLCVYCRSSKDLTRDHIPPRSFFPQPRPTNLITVPCCAECHRDFTINDEYLRNLLIFADGNEDHPAARKLREKGFRSLDDPNKRGYTKSFFNNVNPGWVRYGNGMIAPGATITLDDERIEDVLCRMTVGLFWKEHDKYLPPDYTVEVFGSYDPRYNNWPVQQSVRRLLHDEDSVNIGNGVFQYRWSWDEQAPPEEAHQSDWLLRFYEGTTFLCRVARPQNKMSASHQWASILPG